MDPNMLIELFKTARGIFYRFGSTRLLALAMVLLFLNGKNIDVVDASLGMGAFVLTMLLMMMRPHTAHKEADIK